MLDFTEELGPFTLLARPDPAPSLPKSQKQKILYAPVGGKKWKVLFFPQKRSFGLLALGIRPARAELLKFFTFLKILKIS